MFVFAFLLRNTKNNNPCQGARARLWGTRSFSRRLINALKSPKCQQIGAPSFSQLSASLQSWMYRAVSVCFVVIFSTTKYIYMKHPQNKKKKKKPRGFRSLDCWHLQERKKMLTKTQTRLGIYQRHRRGRKKGRNKEIRAWPVPA